MLTDVSKEHNASTSGYLVLTDVSKELTASTSGFLVLTDVSKELTASTSGFLVLTDVSKELTASTSGFSLLTDVSKEHTLCTFHIPDGCRTFCSHFYVRLLVTPFHIVIMNCTHDMYLMNMNGRWSGAKRD